MKDNKKYIYICLAVVIIAIVGYVAIYKLDILKNKNNDKETTKVEVAKTEVSTNDELLNDPNVKYGKEETGEILKNKINLDIEENLSKKDVRNDHAKDIVIAKVSKINGATNVSKKGEGTIIATNGELEILDVLKGDIKDKKVKFSRAGGKMLYSEYLKGNKASREKLKDNPEMDKYSKEENNKMYIEEYKDDDIKDIYRKQYPDDTKTVDVNKMRKILNKEFSRHRIYFDGDFGYKNQLDELEHWKNVALGVREEDKEKGREIYIDLIEQQKEVNIQRQNNVINILKTQRIPRADYDEDLVKQRNNVLKEELKNLLIF